MTSPESRPPLDGAPGMLSAFAVAVFVAGVFSRALVSDFFQIDDYDLVLDNPNVNSGLSFEGVVWALGNPLQGNWTPVAWLSHMLDVSLFGMWAPGHHAISVLLHAATAGLLFAFLERTTGRRGLSAAAALLFAVHPLRIESVVWVSERRDVLSGLFAVATLLAYSGYVRRRRPAWLCAALGLFGLGVASKATLVTLPFALILVDVWPLGRFRSADRWLARSEGLRRAVLEKLPFLVLSAAASWMTLRAQGSAGALVPSSLLPFDARILNAIVSVGHYLGKSLWPSDLSVMVMHPSLFGGDGHSLASIALGGLALSLGSALAWRYRQQGFPVLGWLWFLGMLVPMLGLVQAGLQALAYRYTYLPHIGLSIGLVWGIAAHRQTWLDSRRLTMLTSAAVLALSVSTVAEIGHWRTTETIFQRSLVASRGAWNQHFNLGRAYLVEKRFAEALPELMKAGAGLPREGGPELAQALGSVYQSIGRALEGTGDLERAAQAYRRSLGAHSVKEVAADLARIEAALGSSTGVEEPP